MANLEVLALDTTVPQIRAPGMGDGYAVPRDMTLSAGTTLTAPTVNATTFDTNVAAAGVTLTGTTLAADGTDTNIDISITPKGTGEVNLTKVDIDAGAIDGTTIGAGSASTGAFTTLASSSGATLDGGVVVNDGGADHDFRVEGDTDANLLFVDASADAVGIGISTPATRLDVRGSTTATIRVGSSSSGGSGDEFGNLEFYWADPDAAEVKAKIYARMVGNEGPGGGAATDLLFAIRTPFSALSERMRITSTGEILVAGNTDNGAFNLQCNGTGVWGAGAYVNGSDARLKDNIQSFDSGLDVVKAMRPVTFQYKPEYSKDQSVQPGFIAQELQEAMAGKPYLEGVVQEGTNHLNVAYQNIIPILVKAIQELEAEVAALKAR